MSLPATSHADSASAGTTSFATSAATAQGNTSAAGTGGSAASAQTAATSAAPPATAVAASTSVANAAQVASIVAAAQTALSNTVNLSAQAQQAVKMEAFNQLVANLVSQIQPGGATMPANWPAGGVTPQLQALLTVLLQNATAAQPLPQQLVSVQSWPTQLINAVLQQAGQQAPAAPALPSAAAPTASAAVAGKPSMLLPALQNWLVQQGSVMGSDGERAFTLTLRVPVAWAQAQAALGSALPSSTPGAAPAAPAGGLLAALPMPGPASPSLSGPGLPGLLQLPFAGSVQQLASGSMGLVMQPQALPGTPAAAAAAAMRTSAILQLEFQPLMQAAQSAQAASTYMPAHLLPQDAQAMLQTRGTDPWLLMAQAEQERQGQKQSKNSNEQANFCNRAGCQY
ncbi:MAG: hypothetical protein KBT18_03535, partial [Comamonas sp.]|nr:hypothetical protein [Candidatus Comamonas equi]